MKTRNQQQGGCLPTLLVLFGCCAFFVGGMFLLWKGLGEPAAAVVAAQSWEAVPCKIISCRLKEQNNSYKVVIHYEYEVNGVLRSGHRYSFFTGSTSGRRGKQKVIDQHPPGTQTICYVNPRDVTDAVLNRQFQPAMLWGLVGIPFAAVGGIGCYGVMASRRERKKTVVASEHGGEVLMPRTGQSKDGITVFENAFSHEALQEVPGPVMLKSESGRWGPFFGLLILSLIWNGVVWISLLNMKDEILNGSASWILLIVLGGFGFIGILLILGTLYSFMKLFNPIPVLKLERSAIPLAASSTLNWQFQGSARSIEQLTLSLQSIERVSYVQGTNTSTEENVLHESVLFESNEPSEIERGEVTVDIPTDGMHSFEALNNKILWRLKVRGTVRFWPDVSESFPIRVVPHE